MKFNVKDLDLDQLEKDITIEANEIWDPNGQREWQNVYDMVSIGKPAENFLKEKGKFTDDPRKYHDVISPSGISVEVKVRNPNKVAETLQQLSELKADPRRYLESDWVFIFQMNGRENYELYGTYKWVAPMEQYMSASFDWKKEWEWWQSLEDDRKFLHSL